MIYFSDFDSATLSDVTIAVQDFATGTTTGSPISYTSATITGLTPAAALIFASQHTPATGASEIANANLGIGFLQGSNQIAMTVTSEDNQTTSDSRKAYSNTTAALLGGYTGSALLVGSAAAASGGIDITYTTTATSRSAFFVAFAGPDITAAVGAHDLGNTTSPTSVSLAFEPDVVIIAGVASANFTATGASGDNLLTFGIATKDGTQRCVMFTELTSNAAGGAPLQAILTNRVGGSLTTAGANPYTITAGGFSGSGFQLTTSAATSGVDVAYMALNFAGRRCKLVDFTTPTSTGSQAITGAGFTPQFALVVLTNLEATDPSFSISTSDLMSGLSICAVGDEQWGHSVRLNSGSDPTDTASFAGNYAVIGASDTDSKAILATLTSFDSDGMTLNYSAVQGTGKKGFILFIE